MISIKLQCSCGQEYAFEIEPFEGRMPATVACPTCGADGTEAANAWLLENAAAHSAKSGGPLRVAAPAVTAPRRPTGTLPGQVDPAQAEVEARAKVSWGDPPVKVLAYLLSQGFSRVEASNLVDEMFAERAAAIRGKGIWNILTGAGLVAVPIIAFIIFMILGYIYVGIFLFTIVVGFGGIWLIFKGIGMLMAPKSTEGDLSEE